MLKMTDVNNLLLFIDFSSDCCRKLVINAKKLTHLNNTAYASSKLFTVHGSSDVAVTWH